MKININIENYEAFWVDYLDGNLSTGQEEALFAFLEENHAIAGNLIDVEDYKIPVFEAEFPGKSKLFSNNQIENLLIAKIENEISEEDNAFITEKIEKDKKVAKSFTQYKKTVLVANEAIVFPNKSSLKKSVRVPLFRYVTSIAAAVAIVFVAGYFLTRNVEVNYGGAPVLTSDLKFVLPNIKIIDSVENNIVNQNQVNSNNVQYANNNIPENIDANSNSEYSFGVPEKLPLKSPGNLAFDRSFSSTNVMEYRYDVPKDDLAYSYTMQYTKTNEENKIVKGFKNIVKFGKGIDVKERWEHIKTVKEDFLYTSMNE